MKRVEEGILLRKIDYSDTSLILKFYTKEEGIKSYLFQGGKRKNKKGNFLQALSIVEITSYSRNDSSLSKITAIQPQYIPQSIPFHPIKSGLAYFMAETLLHVLKSQEKDSQMYRFILEEIKWLDTSLKLTNYPLWFLLKLLEELGIGIHLEHSDGTLFDIKEGTITHRTSESQFFIKDDGIIPVFKDLLQMDKTSFLSTSIKKPYRLKLIDYLMEYFLFHVDEFKIPKSFEVMQTILS